MRTHTTTTCPSCQAKDAMIARLSSENAELRWEHELDMPNRAGLQLIIRTLPATTTYTVVFADLDRLKRINEATGNHLATNRYLRSGLAVRTGEIVGQLYGDEFIFILDEHSRAEDTHPDAFVARIARQLAGQPLLQSERYALAAAQRCHVSEAKLSATFATQSGVSAAQVPSVIERLSCEVLKLKAERDLDVRVV